MKIGFFWNYRLRVRPLLIFYLAVYEATLLHSTWGRGEGESSDRRGEGTHTGPLRAKQKPGVDTTFSR